MKIEFREEILHELVETAKNSYPDECCIFIIGKINGNNFFGDELYHPDMDSTSPVHANVNNESVIEVCDYAMERDKELVAIFHSHPHHIAQPSSTDVSYMELNKVVWIIYSNKFNEINAFLLEDGIVTPVLINTAILPPPRHPKSIQSSGVLCIECKEYQSEKGFDRCIQCLADIEAEMLGW